MNSQIYGALIFFYFYCSQLSSNAREGRQPISRGFLVYRTVSVTQKSCTCGMPNSCACCQNVIILYTKAEKSLCVNFVYQRNGLNVDVTLSSDTIRARTITDYKPFRFCVYVPGCLFSSMCVNVLELNEFPRSVTACVRLDIYSKKQLWQINYDCISVSTELPAMPGNGTTRMIDNTMTSEEIPEMTTEGMKQSTEGTSTPTTTMSEATSEGGMMPTDAMTMPISEMTMSMTETTSQPSEMTMPMTEMTSQASEMTMPMTEMTSQASEMTMPMTEMTMQTSEMTTQQTEMSETTAVNVESTTAVEMTSTAGDETSTATAEMAAVTVEMIVTTTEGMVDVESEEVIIETMVDTAVIETQ